MYRYGFRSNCRYLFWMIVALLLISSVSVEAGNRFTLQASEHNTKDMSVNLGVDALRGETSFGGRPIAPPSSVADKELLTRLLNHDSGVLDVQHTFFLNAALSSRILLQFQSLQEELNRNCWTKEQAPNLRATLRMYVIPPFGPGKHSRLWGISPSVHLPPEVGLDPPPASVPIAVFRQTEPWVEGPGQNSFFTATYDASMLLDVKRVGVAGDDTTWQGEKVEAVDVCLNRRRGLEAVGGAGQRAQLCFDDDPNWQPWVEWDVSEAVRFWMLNDFDPAYDHGFSLYQYPGESPEDQIRISPEVSGFGRSRPVISFASSSGAADCVGAGGVWGGPGELDFVYANTKCMTASENDIDLEDPFGAPREVQAIVRTEWAPQIVIESIVPEPSCQVHAYLQPEWVDVALGQIAVRELVFRNLSPEFSQQIDSMAIVGGNADSFWFEGDSCGSSLVLPEEECRMTVGMRSLSAGNKESEIEINYHSLGQSVSETLGLKLTGTVSEDRDGIPDDVENKAANHGDGNGDNIPDRQQDNVGSFLNNKGKSITVASLPNTLLFAIKQEELSTGSDLASFRFDEGFYSFEVSEFQPGSGLTIEIFGIDDKISKVYQFGPSPLDKKNHWFPFPFDGVQGAVLEEDRMLLYFVDGKTGDLDLEENGRIQFRGGAGRVHFDHANVRLTDATVGRADWLLIAFGVGSIVVLGFRRLFGSSG